MKNVTKTTFAGKIPQEERPQTGPEVIPPKHKGQTSIQHLHLPKAYKFFTHSSKLLEIASATDTFLKNENSK